MKILNEKAWAIKTPKGQLLAVAKFQYMAWNLYLDAGSKYLWKKDAIKAGYKCVPVIIKEKKND